MSSWVGALALEQRGVPTGNIPTGVRAVTGGGGTFRLMRENTIAQPSRVLISTRRMLYPVEQTRMTLRTALGG